MQLSVVILAAGQGTRMNSALPKVLHTLGGRPLLEHVIDTATNLQAKSIHVVYGHGGEHVPQAFAHRQLDWIEQAEQLGTGHAVAQVLPQLDDRSLVLVLYGDVPLITSATLKQLCAAADSNALALLTVKLDNPAGYGRIVRDNHQRVTAIVEEKDATESQRAIREINTGFMAVPAQRLKQWVGGLNNDNAQGEYYLTDIIAAAVADGVTIQTVTPEDPVEILGINDYAQLAELERHYQRCQAMKLMCAGVTLRDPARFDLRGTLQAGRDVTIDVNVILEGDVTLGDRVRIGPGCVIRNTRLADDVEVLPHCVIEDATVGAGARIGPFTRVRPETTLAEHVHVGNFVEVKKSDVDAGSKINHLSYVGDTTVGVRVNVGAGTITCNYDGANKHRTIIGDDVFVGSDTQLVAPVTVGDGATIGAGSTITRDAPPGELTLSRAAQTTRQGWKRPLKKVRSEE